LIVGQGIVFFGLIVVISEITHLQAFLPLLSLNAPKLANSAVFPANSIILELGLGWNILVNIPVEEEVGAMLPTW
jgi:hypothetical protein